MDLSVLQKLRMPCLGECPSGDNLEYDALFLTMTRLAESQPEVQYGTTIVPARLPDWQLLLDSTLVVSERTRDLRAGVLLVECLCYTHAWDGLASGLELLYHWIDHFWDSIHPQLDQDDNFDPTARISILSRLVSNDMLIRSILQIPIVEHRSLGAIALRDYLSCLSAPNAKSGHLTWTEVEAAFDEMQKAELDAVLLKIRRAIKAADLINGFLVGQVGPDQWSGSSLMEPLMRVEQCLSSRVVETVAIPACVHSAKEDVAPSIQESVTTQEPPSSSSIQAVVSQETRDLPCEGSRSATRINSRMDATYAIDSICSYFELNEPASPVPLLLQRAKRLIPMSFIEIIRELAPNESQQMLQQIIANGNAER